MVVICKNDGRQETVLKTISNKTLKDAGSFVDLDQ